jgi:site-specific DNA-methyltransferase (adenine-specific)
MHAIERASIDCILTDPPYQYLDHKLDRPFDEKKFFHECSRVLKPEGFIVLFGRGTAFYRWNVQLADLGFTFKEEIIWDKRYSTSPMMPIHRKHETISLHTRTGKIKRVKIPYLEAYALEPKKIEDGIKRITSALNNPKELQALQTYVQTGVKHRYIDNIPHFNLTYNPKTKVNVPRAITSYEEVATGLYETSIIPLVRDHYTAIHPTQKPVRLLERLLNITSNENDLILDPFIGSGSTAIAAWNTLRQFIGFEIDEDYYKAGNARIQEHMKNHTTLFHNV